MSKRQVIILWAIAAVLGVLVLVIKLSSGDPDEISTERKPGDTLFESFPAESIHRVVIKGVRETLSLEKTGDAWVLVERDNYPADTPLVLDLIRMLDELEITRAIEAGPSLAPRFGMNPNTGDESEHGLEIGFYSETQEELARVTMGKNIETGINEGSLGGSMMVGRYIRNHADESGFYASSELFPAVTDVASSWLRDTFINPEKIESVSVTKVDSKDLEWHLKRKSEDAAFQVVDGKPNEVANSTYSNRLGNFLSYTRFEDVVPALDVPKRSAKEGKREAVINTFEGFTYTLSIIPNADNEEEYLMQVTVTATLPDSRKIEEGESPEDAKAKDVAFKERRQQLQDKLNEAKFFEGRTYLMSQSSIETLLHGRDLMVTVATPAPEPPANQPPPTLLRPGTPDGVGP